jgi:hypothetical protein
MFEYRPTRELAMRRFALVCLICVAVVSLGSGGFSQSPFSSIREAEVGRRGKLDGVWLWTLPDTPNGLRPTQSWHATGSSPDGDIYIAGMDHVTNAALYRLKWQVGKLQLVGDARSVSETVRNWMPGETAQKFHTRPLWHRGAIFVATMDRSTLDDEYLTRRGFHWYAYDPAANNFSDLSAREPGGSAVAHGNVVTLASDPVRNVVYGAGVPTGEIYRYDVARGRTDVLGRPSSYDQPYVYTGRVMWVDSRGRLYFTASNPKSPSVYGHVYYYDPETGFGERDDWSLQEGQALEIGQCLANKKQCIFSDDKGHVYRFNDDGPSWTYIGQIKVGQPATDQPVTYIWLFQVTADATKAYAATSTSPQRSEFTSLYEFDLRTGKTQRLCTLAELDPALRDLHIHTGYDAWDLMGRFYFASFNGQPNQPVVLTRVDPARLKAALNKPL